MRLSELKKELADLTEVRFELENGELVPAHFHVTEVGHESKKFIDCGGQLREEEHVVFQLWTADDFDHRLSAQKLNGIIALSEEQLNLEDLPIIVEYQGDTIGRFELGFNGKLFTLLSTQTDCLAKDKCGVEAKPKVKLSTIGQSSCEPGSGCC